MTKATTTASQSLKIPDKATFPELTEMERHVYLDRVAAMLEKKAGFTFAATLLALGKPIFTTSVATAAVGFANGEVELYFNPRFFDWIVYQENNTLESLKTVVAHEALHVLLDHLGRKMQRDPYLWNLATDVVVNRLLDREYMMSRRFSQLPIATADNLGIPRELSDKTAEEVFAYLEKVASHVQKQGAQTLDDHDKQQSAPGSGSGKGESRSQKTDDKEQPTPDNQEEKDKKQNSEKPGEGQQDEEARNSNTQDSVEEAEERRLRDSVREQLEDAAARDDSSGGSYGSRGWGSVPVGERRLLQKVYDRYKMSWDEILAKRLASEHKQFVVENWLPSRKMRNWYPDVMLPAEHEEEDLHKYTVLVAMDASGSVSPQQLQTMANVLATLPKDKVQLQAISFDTEAYVLKDADKLLDGKLPAVQGGGGTDFNCIEKFAKKLAKEKRYPDIVIVFTDGYASPIKISEPHKWVWLIVPGGDMSVPKRSGGDVCYATQK